MSNTDSATKRLTIKDAAQESMDPNLRRFLRFLGVGPTEFVEFVAIAGKAIYVGGGRGDALVGLALRELPPRFGSAVTPEGIYVVPNKANDAIGGKYSPGKWHAGLEHIKDHEIERRRHFFIDLDPDRIKGTSATDAERRAAQKAADAVATDLKGLLGSLAPVGLGSSGNGWQVHVAIDVPATPEMEAAVRRVLAAVAVRHKATDFGHPVEVDQVVYNAARLCPAFGTKKCKGYDNSGDEPDPTKRRPHRRSFFWCIDDVERLDEAGLVKLADDYESLLTAEQRAEAAALATSKGKSKATATPNVSGATTVPGNLMALAKEHPIADVVAWLGLDERDNTVKCPGCGETKGVDILPERNRLKCLHNRCAGRGNKGCRSNIDLVLEVNGWPLDKSHVKQAAEAICERFGIPYKKPKKAKTPPSIAELSAMAGLSVEAAAELVGISIDTYEPSGEGSDPQGEDVDDTADAPEPVDPDQSEPANKGRNFTDLGNAERLIDLHGQKIRFVEAWGKWLVWGGTRWILDPKELSVRALATATIRRIYTEALDATDPEEQARIVAHAQASEGTGRISNMITEAQQYVRIDHAVLDADPMSFNVLNGTVDLTTGKIRDHRREDYATKLAPVRYDPKADRSLFDSCLAKSQPDPEMREYLLRSWGYSMTGDVGEHVFWLHYGRKGRNGKGTLMNAMAKVLGDYAEAAIPSDVVTESGTNEHPTGLTRLAGKRFCITSETEKSKRLKVSLVKRLTGGDVISARRMREDFWDFDPTHKLHVPTNHKPVIPEAPDDPVWERVHLVPWTVHIPAADRIKNLDRRLATEGAEGMLAALVAGCLDWQAKGLQPPLAVRAAVEEYRDESDVLQEFIDERLVRDQDPKAQVLVGELYEEYRRWAESQGLTSPLTKRRLQTALNEREVGTPDKDTKTSQACRKGIRIATAADKPGHKEKEAKLQADVDEVLKEMESAADELDEDDFGGTKLDLDF